MCDELKTEIAEDRGLVRIGKLVSWIMTFLAAAAAGIAIGANLTAFLRAFFGASALLFTIQAVNCATDASMTNLVFRVLNGFEKARQEQTKALLAELVANPALLEKREPPPAQEKC